MWKTFATKLHLKQHEGRHKKLTCEDCEMNYTTKVDFQAHVDIVHKGLPKLACVECGCSYKRKDVLRRHKNKLHLKVMPYLENIQYDECNKILSNK